MTGPETDRRCRSCHEPIQSKATRCPHCTARQEPWWTSVAFWWTALVAAAVIGGGVVWWNAREQQREQDQRTDELVDCMTEGDC